MLQFGGKTFAFYAIKTDWNAIDPVRKAAGLPSCDLWFAYIMAFAGDYASSA